MFEAEENLIKAKEEIDSLRKQLQETRDKQIVLEGDNASTSGKTNIILFIIKIMDSTNYYVKLFQRNFNVIRNFLCYR